MEFIAPVTPQKTLAQLRTEAGMTQQDLADCLGCRQPMVAKWELGLKPLSMPRINQVLDLFRIGLDGIDLAPGKVKK